MLTFNPDRHAEELRAAIVSLDTVLGRPRSDDGFPRDAWQAIAQTGLFEEPVNGRMSYNENVAGTMFALEALGETCTDSGLSFSVATHLASTITALSQFGSPALQDRYLGALTQGTLIGAHAISEAEAGSDALAMTTTAIRDGDSWVLSGEKAFVTNGPIADLIVVYAKTGDGNSAGDVSAILVPSNAPGVTSGEPFDTVGLTTAPLGTLSLAECRVPAENMIGRKGGGFLVLSHVMKREILYAFIVSVGEMGRRLRRCVHHARTRKQFGVSIGSFQSVSNRIAEMKMRYEISQKWLYFVAQKLTTSQDVTSDIAIAKIFVSEAAIATSIDALHIHGGTGFVEENGLGRDVCSALAGPIYSGTNDIQRGRIAAMMGVTQ